MKGRLTLLAGLMLAGCSDDAPTVTIPLSFCHDQPTQQYRHEHRSAYYSHAPIGKSVTSIYHPAQDRDEQRYIRTCAYAEWRTMRGPH